MSLESKITPMAFVAKDKKGNIEGVADSPGKLKKHTEYATNFDYIAKQYFASDMGRQYLEQNGIDIDSLKGKGSMELEDSVVAAVLHSGSTKYMVSNGDFGKQVEKLASSYGVHYSIAEQFVLDHEATHLVHHDEVKTATTQLNYYNKMAKSAEAKGDSVNAKRYQKLAGMATKYIKGQKASQNQSKKAA